jgi:hypothetical protein
MDNLSKLFQSNVRISDQDPFDKDAIWPNNIELVITRVPIRKRDGYDLEMMKSLAAKLKSNIVNNGIAFLICYAPVECKARPFEVATCMTDVGFTHIDNIVVEKTWFPGKRSEINLVNSHEYVLYFCNGTVWNLDRLPIRHYLKTQDTVSCPGNTWKVDTGSLDESIPLDLVELLMRMTDSLPGSIVFDPFMNNSATFKSAIKLGHSFYGFEQDKKKYEAYKKILKRYQETGEF